MKKLKVNWIKNNKIVATSNIPHYFTIQKREREYCYVMRIRLHYDAYEIIESE